MSNRNPVACVRGVEDISDRYLREEGYPNAIIIDCEPGGPIHVIEVRGEKKRNVFTLSLEDSHNPYVRAILSELVKAYNKRVENE